MEQAQQLDGRLDPEALLDDENQEEPDDILMADVAFVDLDGSAKVSALYHTGSGGNTVVGMATSLAQKEMKELFADTAFWQLNSNKFHVLKEKASSFFPIRCKLSAFIDNVWNPYGWLPDFNSYIVRGSGQEKYLTQRGLEVLKRYTSEENWFCTRINLLLVTDKIRDMNNGDPKQQYAHYVGELKACIGWQTPKWQGLVWRGALHSPVELFMMAIKGTFFIPSFVSTSISPKNIIWDAYDADKVEKEKRQGLKLGHQNCIFEIDTSEWPDFSTLLLDPAHSEYCDTERENLISCYNVYQWVGYQLIKYKGEVTPLVRLKLVHYNKIMDFQTQSVKTHHFPVDASWIEKRGEGYLQRSWSPKQLHRKFMYLRERFMLACQREKSTIPAAFMEKASEEHVAAGFLDTHVHPYAHELYDHPEQDQDKALLHRKQFEALVASRDPNEGIYDDKRLDK